MSPNTLVPSQPYTLSYFITDPNDNNTYYVRAVVYDAITGDVLDTQNLTAISNNPHLFTVRTQAPGDSSGHGRRIVVVATAYEDSGYTTKSPIYQEQSENYIVIKPGAGLTLGGGGGVDWNVIKEMIVEEVGKTATAFKEMTKPLQALSQAVSKIPTEKVKLAPVIDSINELKTAISRIPTDNKTDLSGVMSKIDTVIKAIEDKEVTEKTELQPIQDAIDNLKSEIQTSHTETKDIIENEFSSLKSDIPKMVEKGKKKIIFMLNEAEEQEDEEKKPAPKKRDIMELMGN